MVKITHVIFSAGTLVLENCDIFNWPPTNGSLPYLQKCIKKWDNYTEECISDYPDEPLFRFDIDCLLSKECMCVSNNPAANDIFTFGAYLYPSSIEFSILVGKVIYKLLKKVIAYSLVLNN